MGEDILKCYPTVFKGLGKLYALSAPRHVPLRMLDKVRTEFDQMQSMGVISKVTTHFMVCKSHGDAKTKIKVKTKIVCRSDTPE